MTDNNTTSPASPSWWIKSVSPVLVPENHKSRAIWNHSNQNTFDENQAVNSYCSRFSVAEPREKLSGSLLFSEICRD